MSAYYYSPPLTNPTITRTPRFTFRVDAEGALEGGIHDRAYDGCPVVTTRTMVLRVRAIKMVGGSDEATLNTDRGPYVVSPHIVNSTYEVTAVGEGIIEEIGWAPRSIWPKERR